jgi:hypothetical protein
LKWQNIINQQARARSTNKLGWKKNKTLQGEIGCRNDMARTKTPLKKPPRKIQHLRKTNSQQCKLDNEAKIYTPAEAPNAYPRLKNYSREQPKGSIKQHPILLSQNNNQPRKHSKPTTTEEHPSSL